MVRAVMCLYDGAKTRVRVGSANSEEFEVKLGVHQGSVLSPLLFAIVVDVIIENARRGVVIVPFKRKKSANLRNYVRRIRS